MSADHALVTGASSGIGAEIARGLAARGHPLVIVARRRAQLDALAERIRAAHKVSVTVVARDLSAPDAASALHAEVAAALEPGARIGVLVNNAGFGIQGRFLDMDMARIEQMVRLNVLGLTHLTQLYAADMVQAGSGYILQVASAAAFLPSPYVAAYAATKHYVMAFSEALRYELRSTGVSVTTLYPGITRTEFNAVAGARTPALMNLSILDADAVARIGLNAMFRRKRAIVPGFINKLNAFFSHVLHRGFIVSAAGRLMEQANEH